MHITCRLKAIEKQNRPQLIHLNVQRFSSGQLYVRAHSHEFGADQMPP